MSTMNLFEELYFKPMETTPPIPPNEIRYPINPELRALMIDMKMFFEKPMKIRKTYPIPLKNISKVISYDKSNPYFYANGTKICEFLNKILQKGYYGPDGKEVLNSIRESYVKELCKENSI
jgi:hypothetical protein